MNNFFKEILLIVLKIALPIIVVFGILYLSFNFNFELNPKVMYFALLAVFFLIIFMVPYINKRIKSNYKKNDVVKVKQFFKDLCSKHAEFQGLIDFNAKDNKICDSLSLGLRLLHNTKLIELIYTPDSADIWHLVESFSHKIKFDITEIKIGDVEWINIYKD